MWSVDSIGMLKESKSVIIEPVDYLLTICCLCQDRCYNTQHISRHLPEHRHDSFILSLTLLMLLTGNIVS